jgi:DNA-directed RNA polymerase specialized sigma24 family protein
MQEVPLDAISEPGREIDQSILAMHEALDRLARADPRKAQLVEMRYFGGMTAEESAAALSISVHVVRHELRIAEAWLHKEMAG